MNRYRIKYEKYKDGRELFHVERYEGWFTRWVRYHSTFRSLEQAKSFVENCKALDNSDILIESKIITV